MNNENDILNDESEIEKFNSEIEEDEKIVEELNKKIEEDERRIESYESKIQELENTLSDLESKNEIDGISDETKEKIAEVRNTVTEKIKEINLQKNELINKINETKELIAPKPELLPVTEAPEITEIPEVPINPPVADSLNIPQKKFNYAVLEKEGKIKEIEFKIKDCEFKIKDCEFKIKDCERLIQERDGKVNESNEKIDEKIRVLEEKRSRFEDTANNIDEKMDGDNINDATRERLEEMRDEIQEKIDGIQEKIDELEDKKCEEEDRINDKIDEYNDKIDELNDAIDNMNEEIDGIREEIEEIENNTVDEDIINQLKNLPGFINFNTSTEVNIPRAPEVNISKINVRIPEAVSPEENAERLERRRKRREHGYNINFCEGAKIDSFCCQHNDDERAEYLIDDDPDLKTKWCADARHVFQPHWAIVDFGEVKKFNYVKMVKCSEGYSHRNDTGDTNRDASAWHFEVSNDRDNWIEFNRETNEKSAIYKKGFEPVSGRYVKLSVDAGGSNPENHYHEVTLHDLQIGTCDESGNIINFCKNAKCDYCCGDNERSLIDGSLKTKWYVQSKYNHDKRMSDPHWIIIDFGEAKTFNHLRLIKASEGNGNQGDKGNKRMDASAWRFEISDNKINWKEFNRETNDQSSIYIKTFEPQTGRYVRLWVDAAESDPRNKNAHVRLYDLRIELIEDKANDSTVSFDDIIAIAPFAKKETLDKLVDKLIETDNFGKIKEIAKFLSKEAIDKLALKASGKGDFNTVKTLAPYLSQEALEIIAEDLDGDEDFEKIKALAPFLSKEVLVRRITSSGKVDMKRLKSLAPFLGPDWIDEIISKML
ncbi:MAG: discoidin domain-containing protein [Oscillospiraceae bacterium]|nr:discoidin domain-containing protein [Oscillospiraceae bacterium]